MKLKVPNESRDSEQMQSLHSFTSLYILLEECAKFDYISCLLFVRRLSHCAVLIQLVNKRLDIFGTCSVKRKFKNTLSLNESF